MKHLEEKSGGLTSGEARRLLEEHGENVLARRRGHRAAALAAAQFRDVFVLILLAAAAASFLMGNGAEALAIAAIVFLNAALGFVQEYRTERTLEALRQLSAPRANVVRDGLAQQIPAAQVVPGDLLLLEAGDSVPADARLTEAAALGCNESMLSGESVPVGKQPGDGVFMGTTVVRGRGRAVVTATGMSTEMGRIAGMLRDIAPGPTPLQGRLDEMGRWIGAGCLAVCAAVSLTGILRGESLFSMLLLGISLAVAAIPEGLCAIVTVSLALAVRRILRRNALVRRLHTVETLGCADVICSDKTGTLTENRMTVTEVSTAAGSLTRREGTDRWEAVSGGRFAGVQGSPVLRRLLEVAVVCNNARQPPARRGPLQKGAAELQGDPTELALLEAGRSFGLGREGLGWSVCGEEPFDSARKMMSVTARQGGQLLLFTKGAPDCLLERCTHVLTAQGPQPLTAPQKSEFLRRNTDMAGRALRVLAFAFRPASGPEDLQEWGLVLAGLMAMMDPPRREAAAAVSACRRAGIRPVMITGDSRPTACAVAAVLRIMTPGDGVLTGQELERMDGRQLAAAAEETAVYCRVTPEHKLRIVRALKARGHVVAMTGDGVNDAPAIKEADIGVSMGRSGTDISREASSLVLLDDNFATLVAAVEEGRVVYANIRKFMRYLLSCNIGEVFTMFVGMLMGLPVVLTPIQILFVNLVTDGLPAMSLGADPSDGGEMRVPPRGRGESVFSGGLATRIWFRGCMIGLSTLLCFTLLYRGSGGLGAARTGALVTLISAQLLHAFECRSERLGLFEPKARANPALAGSVLLSAALSLALVYLPAARAVFSTVQLSAGQLGLAVGISALAPLGSSLLLALGGAGRGRG